METRSPNWELFKPWRVGRKVGRTVYVVVDDLPGDDDLLIGMMDTPAQAQSAVTCHNYVLEMGL